MKTDTFTFGVLAYNHEAVILETLESMKYQIEHYGGDIRFFLIITDDASHDNTPLIIKNWVDENRHLFADVNLRLNEQNVGTVKNYNYILHNITEENFKIIAGDDVFSSDNLFTVYEGLEENSLLTCVPLVIKDGKVSADRYRYTLYYYNKKHNNKKRFEKRMRRDCFVHTPSTIFSKKLYEAAGCEKNTRQFRLIEDAPTWYSIIKSDCFRSLLYSDSTIVLYRKSGVSVSKNRDPQNPFHLEKKKLYKIYAEDAQGLERLFLKLRNSNLRALNVVFSRFNAILNYAGVLTLVLDIGYYRFAKEMKIRAEKEQQYYMHLKERTSNLYASH